MQLAQMLECDDREMKLLRPWYDRGALERGRTPVGLSGRGVDALPGFLGRYLSGAVNPEGRDRSPGELLKLAAEDLKAFYNEAATAQPGQATASEIEAWHWNDRKAGERIRQIATRCRDHPDRLVQETAGFLLVPSSQARRSG